MYYGFVLLHTEDKKEGEKVLDIVTKYYSERLESNGNSPYLKLSKIYSCLGNKETSVRYLQDAFKIGYVNYKEILTDPMYDNIRDDERVQELLNNQKQKLQKMQANLAMMEAANELEELRKR